MSESLFLTVAVFVFVMMVIGLTLTVMEFRYGQPRREDKRSALGDETHRSPHLERAAGTATR